MSGKKHERDEAAEHLRLTLPLMAKHAIPVTPSNYAVWYEYVSGTNEPLKVKIDTLIEKESPINEEITEDLYQQFVMGTVEKRLQKARQALRSLLDDVDGSFSRADEEAIRYEESLARVTGQLQGDVSTTELRDVVQKLSEETHAMRDTGSKLQERLEASRKETEALRKELEQARNEASTDALTGLANRKAFFRSLEQMADGKEQPCSLILADIDHFKAVNDNYGHLIGDKVIRFIGSIMKNTVKGKDVVARYGGEEFAILLPDTDYESALAVGESIRAACEAGRLVRSDTREPLRTVTVSSGVALYRPGEPFDDLIARADEALYHAKQNGRNRVSGETELVKNAS